MRIQNITGNGTWQTVALPADGNTYEVYIQNSASVAVSVRMENNTSEEWTVKSGDVAELCVAPKQDGHLAVQAASGTIEVRYEKSRC